MKLYHPKYEIQSLLPVFVIILLSFLVYVNALFCDFVKDDMFQIVNNPWIKDMKHIPAIFSKGVWSFSPDSVHTNIYRPLMHVVYMVNYLVFGLKPWGFHLINILFHCGCSVLVFLIMQHLLPGRHDPSVALPHLQPPFTAALLFATHPIHTEAVTWIAGLPDVAFTFFYLLSFYLYVIYREGARGAYAFSVLFFSLSALFKEPALTLPLLLIAYDHLFRNHVKPARLTRAGYLPFAVISGIYLIVRHGVLKNIPQHEYHILSSYQYIINIFPLLGEYLSALFIPLNQNALPMFHPIESLLEPKGIISVFIFLIFIGMAAVSYHKNKTLFLCFLFFIVPLMPAFHIQAIPTKPFAERYLYLPSVGFVYIVALLLSWTREKIPSAATSLAAAFLLIIGTYGILTINRNRAWTDNFTIWSDTVLKSPDSVIAHVNLGAAYEKKGRIDEALREYHAAIAIDPFYAVEPYVHLGRAELSRGRIDEAIEQLRIALSIKPSSEIYKAIADAYKKKGMFEEAELYLAKAGALDSRIGR